MMMTLNTETENAMRMALNADTEKWWLWQPKLRSGDGSECQNWEAMMMTLNPETEKYDSERQIENRWWL